MIMVSVIVEKWTAITEKWTTITYIIMHIIMYETTFVIMYLQNNL